MTHAPLAADQQFTNTGGSTITILTVGPKTVTYTNGHWTKRVSHAAIESNIDNGHWVPVPAKGVNSST